MGGASERPARPRYDAMSSSALHVHQPEAADARSLSERAYFAIREQIITLELAPGSVVSERDLMQQLELGRTPVREGLRRLAWEGLVEVYPRRGMFVSTVDVRDLAGLSEVRIALEPVAARLASQRATDDDRSVIRTLLDELARAADEHDERTLIELDQRIHRHVYRCTHNPFLEETLVGHYLLTLRIWFLALDRVAHLGEAVHEHRRLLEAIRDGDGDAAAGAMGRHVETFEAAIRAVL